MNKLSRQPEVYYLPVELTQFQKDLIEILVSLHATAFRNEVVGGEKSGATTSADAPSLGKLSSRRLTYMLDNNIRAVANHPCLLVDHYMPRQFLLMEPNERLVSTSDKFRKFEQLLSSITYRDRSKSKSTLKVVLIAHSIRELDLLEGFILGKHFRIKRLSGTSLYDEKHVFLNKESDDLTSSEPNSGDNSSLKSETPGNESNKYTGYTRDDYTYSTKKRKRDLSDESNRDDWIFLTTTTHLMHDSMLLVDYEPELIISFDPVLDPAMDGIKNIRTRNHRLIPLIKMLVKDSPDHYILERCGFNTPDEYNVLKQSLLHFLYTRHNKQERTEKVDYQKLIEFLLSTRDNTTGDTSSIQLPNICLSDVADSANLDHIFIPHLSKLEFSDNVLTISKEEFNLKTYDNELMRRTISRMEDIQNEYNEKNKILNCKRLDETERQNAFDEIKYNIGQLFKEFQENEKIKLDHEKRLEGSKTENEKLLRRLEILKTRESELSKLADMSDALTIQEALSQYKKKRDKLKTRVTEVKNDAEKSTAVNDALRKDYQVQSGNALQMAQKSKSLKKSLDVLQKELQGSLTKAEYRMHVHKESRLAKEIQHLQQDNTFLEQYIESLASQHNLKASMYGDDTSRSSQFLYTDGNGRTSMNSSRHRSTRANFPAYT